MGPEPLFPYFRHGGDKGFSSFVQGLKLELENDLILSDSLSRLDFGEPHLLGDSVFPSLPIQQTNCGFIGRDSLVIDTRA